MNHRKSVLYGIFFTLFILSYSCVQVSAATGSGNGVWWNENAPDSVAWTARIPINLTEPFGADRTDEPVTLRFHDLFGYGFDYTGINPDSFRVVDPDTMPDEPGELNGNDVASQVEYTSGGSLLTDNDLLIFIAEVPANSEKTYYIYYSRNSAVTRKTYDPIVWNLVKNAGFEDETESAAANWQAVGKGYSRVSGSAHTGTYSIKMTSSNDQNTMGLRQSIAMSPTKKWNSLTMGVWVKADSVNGTRNQGNSLYVDTHYDPTGALYAKTALFNPGTYNWQLFEITIEPTDPVKDIDPYLYFKDHEGTVWIDDITIFPDYYAVKIGPREGTDTPNRSSNPNAIHPRLYFSSEDIPTLKTKMDQVPVSATWNEIKHTALTLNTFPSGIDDDHVQWDAWAGLRYTAVYYALTGDITVGNKGKKWLLETCSWTSWNPRTSASHNYVNYDTGKIAIAVGEAYDMLYPLLTEDERATVRQAILEKAVKPAYLGYTDGSYLVDAKTNRAAQGYGGIGVAALAIKGDGANDGDLVHYLNATNAVIKEYLNEYDPDGAWPEGIGYESYGLADGSGALYYLEADRRVTGENLYTTTGFSRIIDYPLYMLPPDRKSAADSFGDTSFSAGYSAGAMNILSDAFNDGRGKWYLENSPVYTFDKVPIFIWSNASIPLITPDALPTSKLFQGVGVAVMRTGWNSSDTMMAFRSGPIFPGHNRPEQNSFTYDALGERFVIEPGMPGSQGYDDSSYKSYYAATVSQNTILINGDPHSQNEMGINGDKISKPAGTVTDYFADNFYSEVTGDATAAYDGKLTKFNRHIIFIKPDYAVILDDLESADKPVEFDSLLHALGSDSINVSGDTVTIMRNGKKLDIRTFIPSFTYTVSSGQPYYAAEGAFPTSSIRMHSSVPSTKASYLYVFTPVPENGSAPEVSKIQSGVLTGVKIRQNGTTDLVLFNPAGSGIVTNGVTTDGNKAYIRLENGNVTRFALQNGKILSYNGTVLFSSAQETSFAFDYNSPNSFTKSPSTQGIPDIFSGLWSTGIQINDALKNLAAEINSWFNPA